MFSEDWKTTYLGPVHDELQLGGGGEEARPVHLHLLPLPGDGHTWQGVSFTQVSVIADSFNLYRHSPNSTVKK